MRASKLYSSSQDSTGLRAFPQPKGLLADPKKAARRLVPALLVAPDKLAEWTLPIPPVFFLHQPGVESIRLRAATAGYELVDFSVIGSTKKKPRTLPLIDELTEIDTTECWLSESAPATPLPPARVVAQRHYDSSGRLAGEVTGYGWTEIRRLSDEVVEIDRGVSLLPKTPLMRTTVSWGGGKVEWSNQAISQDLRFLWQLTTEKDGEQTRVFWPDSPIEVPNWLRRIELTPHRQQVEVATLDGRGERRVVGLVPSDSLVAVLRDLLGQVLAQRFGPSTHPLKWYALGPLSFDLPASVLTEGVHPVPVSRSVLALPPVRTHYVYQAQAQGFALYPADSRTVAATLETDGTFKRIRWVDSARSWAQPAEGSWVELVLQLWRNEPGPDTVNQYETPTVSTPREVFVLQLGGQPTWKQAPAVPKGSTGQSMRFVGQLHHGGRMFGDAYLFVDDAAGEVCQVFQTT